MSEKDDLPVIDAEFKVVKAAKWGGLGKPPEWDGWGWGYRLLYVVVWSAIMWGAWVFAHWVAGFIQL
jgi:hypothetical protein